MASCAWVRPQATNSCVDRLLPLSSNAQAATGAGLLFAAVPLGVCVGALLPPLERLIDRTTEGVSGAVACSLCDSACRLSSVRIFVLPLCCVRLGLRLIAFADARRPVQSSFLWCPHVSSCNGGRSRERPRFRHARHRWLAHAGRRGVSVAGHLQGARSVVLSLLLACRLFYTGWLRACALKFESAVLAPFLAPCAPFRCAVAAALAFRVRLTSLLDPSIAARTCVLGFVLPRLPLRA